MVWYDMAMAMARVIAMATAPFQILLAIHQSYDPGAGINGNGQNAFIARSLDLYFRNQSWHFGSCQSTRKAGL